MIELYAGLHGWAEGAVAEGWRVVGFDLYDMCKEVGYPRVEGDVQLVLQDVLTLHGSQFKDADLIVGSSPCQEFSYRAMPWKRAKALGPPELGMALFNAQFRIQREACEAAGRYIPLIVENVRGAQPWIGRSRWNFGSYHLWGDVPALMPLANSLRDDLKRIGPKWNASTQSGAYKMKRWTNPAEGFGCICTTVCDCQNPEPDEGVALVSQECPVHNLYPDPNPECHIHNTQDGTKNGNDWFGAGENCSLQRRASSGSKARRRASALIARIPLPLSQHIARVFKPKP